MALKQYTSGVNDLHRALAKQPNNAVYMALLSKTLYYMSHNEDAWPKCRDGVVWPSIDMDQVR